MIIPFFCVNPANGQHLLHQAAKMGEDGLVSFLIENGMELNLGCKSGITALHSAAFMGHSSIVELLLKNNAIPNLGDLSGKTPAHYASMKGNEESLSMLIKSEEFGLHDKIDLNIVDKDDQTPIFVAVREGKINLIKPLVKAGASTQLVGITLPKLAASMKDTEMLKEVIRCGAPKDEDFMDFVASIDDCDQAMRESLTDAFYTTDADLSFMAASSEEASVYAVAASGYCAAASGGGYGSSGYEDGEGEIVEGLFSFLLDLELLLTTSENNQNTLTK